MKWFHFAFAGLISTGLFAEDQFPVRDRIARFLETSVIGRTQLISAKGSMVIDGQNYSIDFTAKIFRSNLQKTPEGLIFEEQREIRQINTPVDVNGAATGDSFNADRVVVQRYAVTERETTHSLVGLSTTVENSKEDTTGQGNVVMMEISDNDKELYIYESMAGFVERSLDGINIQPVSIATSSTLYLDSKGKLNTDETLKFYKVDVNRDFAREEINRFNLSAVETDSSNNYF
ncbi:MAG: hypothetical protein HQK54_08530 [Oligoflexales bacterium]|nr:hypothetical protein [Oligoflexales bacterium]